MEEFPGESGSGDEPGVGSPTTPPSAMPPSMPLAGDLGAPSLAGEAGQTSAIPAVGPGAMPLSMPPIVDLEAAIPPSGQGAQGGEAANRWADLAAGEGSGDGGQYGGAQYGGAQYGGGQDDGRHARGWSRKKSLSAVLLAVLLAGVAGAGIGSALSSKNTTSASSPVTGTTLPKQLTPITSGSAAPLAPSSSVSAIAKAVTPAVVDINTTINSSGGTGQAAGSGMIVTSSGEVLTNNHVVQGATTISVSISGRPQPVSASVIGVDPVHDVALLQLQGVSNLPHVVLGDSSTVRLGASVVAIGNALGLGGPPTVTAGQVTALDRSITANDSATTVPENLSGLIQTDAEIQPGDSGGPLVNSSGQVIGIDTAAASSDGGPSIGFAIPINQARSIAQDIVAGVAHNGIILGLSAFLGVDVQPANATQTSPIVPGFGGFGNGSGGAPSSSPTSSSGQFVVAVVAGGPAAAAGIVAGDTITSLNTTKITNDGSTLTGALSALKPGDTVKVGVVNQAGASQTVSVVLGAIPK